MFTLYTTNLLTSPPQSHNLQRPPPEIRLPPNSCVLTSPTANADPSYLRSTTATGHLQEEQPTHGPSLEDAAINAPPPPQHHGKRRQYAPGQTQAYYAGDTAVLDPTYVASGASVQAQPQGRQCSRQV